MNLFQILVLATLGVALSLDLMRLRRERTWFNLLRIAAWISIALAVSNPGLVQWFAQAIGIGRGADVLLYFCVLALVAACFFFYARYLRLEEQITELARTIAIDKARRGGGNTR